MKFLIKIYYLIQFSKYFLFSLFSDTFCKRNRKFFLLNDFYFSYLPFIKFWRTSNFSERMIYDLVLGERWEWGDTSELSSRVSKQFQTISKLRPKNFRGQKNVYFDRMMHEWDIHFLLCSLKYLCTIYT